MKMKKEWNGMAMGGIKKSKFELTYPVHQAYNIYTSLR